MRTALLSRLTVREAEPLGAGDFCHAYLVNGDRVVRVPKHARAARALAREACLLPRIGRFLPAPVPVPDYVAGPDPGRSFAIHDHVAGDPLTAQRWRAMAPASRTAVAGELGRFLAALHGVDRALARPCGLPRLDSRTDASRLLAAVRAGTARVPDPSGSLARSLDRCLSDGLLGDPSVVLHGDVSPEHVLVDARDGLAGVIDWGDVAFGDPARDFIFLYEDWGDEFLRLAVAGYGPTDPGRFRSRVLAHYLVDQLEWTVEAAAAGRRPDLEHGVAALDAAVVDFEGSV